MEKQPLSYASCLHCGNPLKGRKDKKFCDVACRNTHNNAQKNEKEAFVIQLNAQLRLNWKILKTINPEGKSTIRKTYLRDLGYNFNYFTNIFRSTTGNVYFFCYDLGLMEIDKTHVCIVKWQTYMEKYQLPLGVIME